MCYLLFKIVISSLFVYKIQTFDCSIDDFVINNSLNVASNFPPIINITDNFVITIDLNSLNYPNADLVFLNYNKAGSSLNCKRKKMTKTIYPLQFSFKDKSIKFLLVYNNSYNPEGPELLLSKEKLDLNLKDNRLELKNVDPNLNISITCRNSNKTIVSHENFLIGPKTSKVPNTIFYDIKTPLKLYCFVYTTLSNKQQTELISYEHVILNQNIIYSELKSLNFIGNDQFTLNYNFLSTLTQQYSEFSYKLYFFCIESWCTKEKYKTIIIKAKDLNLKHCVPKLGVDAQYQVNVTSKFFDCESFDDKLNETLYSTAPEIQNLSHYYRNLTHLWIKFQNRGSSTEQKINFLITDETISKPYIFKNTNSLICNNNNKFNCIAIEFNKTSDKISVQIENNIGIGDKAKINVKPLDKKFYESFMSNISLAFNQTNVTLTYSKPYLKTGPFSLNLTTSNNLLENMTQVFDFYDEIYQKTFSVNFPVNFFVYLAAENKYEKLTNKFDVQMKQVSHQNYQMIIIKVCNLMTEDYCDLKIQALKQLNNIKKAQILMYPNNKLNNNCPPKEFKSNSNNIQDYEDIKTLNLLNETSSVKVNSKLFKNETHSVVLLVQTENSCLFYPFIHNQKDTNMFILFGGIGLVTIAIIIILAIFIYFIVSKRKNKFKNQGSSSQPETELILLRSNEYERLIAEFKKIPNICKNKTTNIGCANMDCNRYKNIIPYDDTLVTLKNAKYINASFVQGYKTEKAFIATQAPMNSTINEFWQMIAEYNVSTIIMLTELIEDNKIQSEKYWPDIHQAISYQNGSVFTQDCKCFSDYTISTIKLKFKEKTKLVQHFQFTAWSSDTLPMYEEGYLKFLRDLKDKKTPIVVHCSAGCGRTGTFILCSNLMKLCDSGKKVSFAQGLQQLRQCRPYMVKNHSQYIYAHLILYNYMHTQQFIISIKENFNEKVKVLLPKLKTHLRQIQTFYPLNEQRIIINSNNRVSDNSHGYLSPINSFNSLPAVVVPCYRSKNKFIVTQQPHHRDVIHDFWRLVVDEGIQTIIVLNEFDAENNTVFYPQKLNESLPIDAIIGNIQTKDIKEDNFVTSHTVKLQDKLIQLIKMKNWRRQDKLPQNQESLFTIWQTIWNFSRDKILVCCHDGVTASGLFVGLCYFLEQINNEQVCNIFEALKNIKQSRYEFLESDEQVLFIAQMAQSHSDQIRHYTRVDEEADLINTYYTI